MIQITHRAEGTKEINDLLAEISRVPQDEGPLTQAGAVLLNRIRDRFLKQEAPDGTPWPVSQAAIDRAISGRDGGTLFDTGALFHSLSLRKPKPLQRAIYTDVPYGFVHQEGLGQVQRVFLGFSQGDITIIDRFVRTRLEEVK